VSTHKPARVIPQAPDALLGFYFEYLGSNSLPGMRIAAIRDKLAETLASSGALPHFSSLKRHAASAEVSCTAR
jgi:hypothetical protein